MTSNNKTSDETEDTTYKWVMNAMNATNVETIIKPFLKIIRNDVFKQICGNTVA
jgi:hypothetical protein